MNSNVSRFVPFALTAALVLSLAGAGGPRFGGVARAQANAGGAQTAAAVVGDLGAALERVSADSLRGHVSFLASDALEGRRTPSRGLDLAAEYVAAQFRRAGLEPAGDDGYFQTANWLTRGRTSEGFALRFDAPAGATEVGAEQASLTFEVMGRTFFSAGPNAVALERAPVFKVAFADAAALAALRPEQLKGRVVVTEIPDFRREDRSLWREALQARQAFLRRLEELGAAAVVSVERQTAAGTGGGTPRLIDPENRPAQTAPTPPGAGVPFITAHGPRAASFYDSLKPGATESHATLRLPAPGEQPVKVRNVVGLLRGSDPSLKDTYVILSAHYDHIGVLASGEGDRVNNGANDNGSGTAAVMEIASALSALKTRPKRSVLFVAFFGEELGLLGSKYYGRHPVVPIEKTVAQVNLEQVGRTDDSEGPQISTAAVTGYDFSDVGETLRASGERVGVRFYKHPRNSDAYFGRSDNQALADLGVPAHTLGVAFAFPDYHGAGDHWDKIDYDNMARVVRAVGLTLLLVADNPRPPRWDEKNPKTAKYVEAWKRLQEGRK
ncbi:MAG TPA: M28 family peptidase [Pyrinomonadaceae bacterium]|nr:M28 family peptidase [Pyrinomonadaceae bacterium]